MTQGIAEFTALVNRAGTLRRGVAWNPAGERELGEQALQPGLVLTNIGVNLAVRALEISTTDDGGAAMSGSRHVNHVQVVALDDPIQMGVYEILSWGRSPMSQQHALHVRDCERFFQQRVVTEINLADGQVVGRAPVGIYFPSQLDIERRQLGLLLHYVSPFGSSPSTRLVKVAIRFITIA